jgi:hypothetical protein
MDLNQIVTGIVLTKTCKVSPDEDSNESKTVTLRVKFDGVKLADVFEKALSSTVIQVQAKLRKEYASLVDHSTKEVVFSAPTRSAVDPMEYVIAQAALAKMTPEAWLKAEMMRRQVK